MGKKAQIDLHWEFDGDTSEQLLNAVVTRLDGSVERYQLATGATAHQMVEGPNSSFDFAVESIAIGGKSALSAALKVVLGDLETVIAIDPDSAEPVVAKNLRYNVTVIDEPEVAPVVEATAETPAEAATDVEVAQPEEVADPNAADPTATEEPAA